MSKAWLSEQGPYLGGPETYYVGQMTLISLFSYLSFPRAGISDVNHTTLSLHYVVSSIIS